MAKQGEGQVGPHQNQEAQFTNAQRQDQRRTNVLSTNIRTMYEDYGG